MERKLHNFKSIILKEETIKEFGYDPDTLGKTSSKFVLAICRVCGKEHKIRKGFFVNQNSACHKECKIIEIKHFGSPFSDKEVREKSKNTIKKRYGVENVSQNKDISLKIELSKKIKKCEEGENNILQSHKKEELLKKYKENKKIFINDIVNELNKLNIKNEINEDLDIKIIGKNIIISLSNNYFNSELNLSTSQARNVHINKLKKYRKDGIRLFTIFENQWTSRKKQFLNCIKSAFGNNKEKIGARKCNINYKECKDFIDSNHIQGYKSKCIKFFNLVYKDEIVASMTASTHHRQNIKGNPIILNRLVFKDGLTIQGGASKLFKEFKTWAKNEGYDKILSWSDNCYSQGDIYHTLGFNFIKEYPSDYFYWDISKDKYLSKQSQKKNNTGCPKDMTERQFCISKGLYRIYDCGKKKFEYNI